MYAYRPLMPPHTRIWFESFCRIYMTVHKAYNTMGQLL